MKYYFIGIKGSGMSALAIILKQLGNDVYGSDLSDSYFTDENLKLNNISVECFNSEFSADIAILGNAFKDDHEQVIYAKNNGIKVMRYTQFLAKMSKEYNAVAIAGTNGKTTTTGLLNAMIKDKKICLIGDGTGYADKNANLFIFEACEYKGHFKNYYPQYAIINNIEMDHPDFFNSIDHVVENFQEFADNAKNIIINGDDENCQKIKHASIYTFGFNENNTLRCSNLSENKEGYTFNLIYNNENKGEFDLNFTGKHMIYNSLGSILTGLLMGYEINELVSNINKFQGVKRRFETTIISEKNKIILIDDYAHHPTAIDLTIDAIRQKYPNYKLYVLFQPHTYSRTVEFLDEFANSLIKADELYLLEIFGSVREENDSIDINILKNEIIKKNKHVHSDIDFLKSISKNSVIALLGAGDIDKLYKNKIIDMMGDLC